MTVNDLVTVEDLVIVKDLVTIVGLLPVDDVDACQGLSDACGGSSTSRV